MTENRVRNRQLKFWATNDEEIIIREKANKANMKIERYLRNSAIRANIIVYDLTSIFELSSQISHIGNNINQIAKRINQGENIYNDDINFLKESMKSITDVIANLYQDMIKTIREE